MAACYANFRMQAGVDMSSIKKIFEVLFISVATLVLLELGLRGLEALQYRAVQFDQFKAIYSDESDKPHLFGLKPNIKVRLEKGF
ncbi:MAG: hypothetical protein RL274_526 [Pseudomonadota bacterium]|jgi:hypothetical protein